MGKTVSFRVILFLTAALVIVGCSLDPDDNYKINKPPEANEFEWEVFKLTNIERVNRGLAPFEWHTVLASVARGHSEDMADNNFMDHTGSDGSSPFDRMSRAGILYSSAAENVAAGYQTPEDVVAGWMASEGHRNNILNSGLTHLGVGYAYNSGSYYRHYWTQAFIKPR